MKTLFSFQDKEFRRKVQLLQVTDEDKFCKHKFYVKIDRKISFSSDNFNECRKRFFESVGRFVLQIDLFSN